MKALLVSAALVAACFSIIPVASACINNCEPLVGHCVGAGKCGGHAACIWFSEEVPTCVDVPQPCQQPWFECDPSPPISSEPPNFGPLVGVCAHEDGCYGGHDVCVGFSEEIPFCVDTDTPPCACTPIEAALPNVVLP